MPRRVHLLKADLDRLARFIVPFRNVGRLVPLIFLLVLGRLGLDVRERGRGRRHRRGLLLLLLFLAVALQITHRAGQLWCQAF